MTWDVSLALWQEKGLLARELRLYEELAAKGLDITIISWGGEEEREIAARFPFLKVLPVYAHMRRPQNKALRALASLYAPFALRSELKNAGGIYKTNQMWGAWVAVIAKILYRRPLILRCGFELYDFTLRQNHGFLRRAFIWLISFLSYRAADHVVVATEEDSAFVQKNFGIPVGKISVRPNWIDVERFKPLDEQKKAGHVLFVGRLNAQKNLAALLKAIAKTGYMLDIAGAGELEGELKALAKALAAKVNFLGTLPNDQLPALYNRYPVYILPSHYEGNPKTLLEAMACGCAVIGTNVPGIANVIAHEKTGLICGADEAEIAAALTRLMGDEALRTKLGQAARAQIENTQSLKITVEKEIALVMKFAGKNS